MSVCGIQSRTSHGKEMMIHLYPRPLQIIGGLAVLSYIIVLGICFYGVLLLRPDPGLFTALMVSATSAVVLGLIAGVWADRFRKHYRETQVFSGKIRIIHTQIVRDDTGTEAVELFCAVSEEDNCLKVFRVPSTDTTRGYRHGDTVDLVWTGTDPHQLFETHYQYAHPA